MQVEEFVDFLSANGLEFHTTDRSIVLRESPCCGDPDKIYMFKDSNKAGRDGFYGKCMKCDTEWSSRTYLAEMGIDSSVIAALHGIENLEGFSLTTLPTLEIGGKTEVDRGEEIPEAPAPEFSVDGFFQVSDFPDHEAARYAVSRGWTSAWEDTLMIDIMANAVVFVCREDGKVVGYQKRFLHPSDPKKKTKSVSGFRKTQHLILFPGNGDLTVCEGPFNGLSAWHYGRSGVVTFGSAVSERQVELIAAMAKRDGKSVGIAFDLDAAGRKGYRRLRLSLYWRGVNSYRIKPEFGNDLNDSWKAGKGLVVIPPELDDVTVPDLDMEDLVYGRG